MKNGKVAISPESMKIGGKAGKKGGDWSQGSDLAEGVSAHSKAGNLVDAYSPDEAKNRMPKGHDRI